MELRHATIGEFDGESTDYYVGHYYIDTRSLSYLYCAYDENNMQIIDINNGKKYRLIQRDEKGKLDPSEASKIRLYEKYALYLHDVNFNRMTQSEKRLILLRYYKTLLSLKLNLNLNPKKKLKDKTGKIIYLSEYRNRKKIVNN